MTSPLARAAVRGALAAAATALLGVAPPLAAQAGTVPAPERIWAAQTGPRELTLAWDSAPGATGFRLYKVGGSGADTARVIGNVVAAVRRWVVVVTPAMISAPQQFAIEALDAAKRPSPRAAFNVVTPIAATPGGGPLPGPATVTASEGGGGVTVTWDAVPGATAYVLGRAVRPGGFRPLCTLCSTSTTYVDRNPTPGALHAYSVTAVTPRANSRTTRSNEITPTGGGIVAGGGGTGGSGGTTGGTDTSGGTGTGGTGSGGTGGSATDSTAGTGGTGGTTATTPPPPPTGLVVKKVGPRDAELTWQSSAGATSYKVSRQLCNKAAQPAGEVAASAGLAFREEIPMTAIVGSCPTGWTSVSVQYHVHAVNAAGTSATPGHSLGLYFDVIVPEGGGTTAAGGTAPAPPMPISATASGRNATLVWQVSPGVTSYQIYRTMCVSTPQLVATVTPTPGYPSATHSDVVPWDKINATCPVGATTWDVTYGIAAVGPGGTSAPAKFPSVRLDFGATVYGTAPPPNVMSPTATKLSDGTVRLMWYPTADVKSVRIERAVGAKGAYQQLITVMEGTTSWVDKEPKIAYMQPSYRFVSWNPNGYSAGVVVNVP